jgi:glycosyltransferase involved in cell wall biosynthesis
LYHSLVKEYIHKNGKPELIHVHITLRCGLVALYYKWRYKVPYILTEQHTVYLHAAKNYEGAINLFNFFLLRLIFKNASVITPVSEALGDELRQKFKVEKIKAIHNVVNTAIFRPQNKSAKRKKRVFIHVSTLTPQKNSEQMLEAFTILKHQFHKDFNLVIVGPRRQHLLDLTVQLNINENVEWYKEMSQQDLAALLQKADAFVLYSRYETFGCVNIEAMACGLPVIVSDIPVFREYLLEGLNAYFAESENPQQLAKVLHSFICSNNESSKVISQYARKFSYEVIGKQIQEVYYEVINRINPTQEK